MRILSKFRLPYYCTTANLYLPLSCSRYLDNGPLYIVVILVYDGLSESNMHNNIIKSNFLYK